MARYERDQSFFSPGPGPGGTRISLPISSHDSYNVLYLLRGCLENRTDFFELIKGRNM
jgi:hypothetical protein